MSEAKRTKEQPMTDEQAALAWLNRAYSIEDQGKFGTEFSDPHRATLQRLLAQPRLPTFEVFERAFDAWLLEARETISYGGGGNPRALYAHLTKPRTKTVEVWRIEYAERHHVTGDWLPCTETWPTEEYILNKEKILGERSDVACIRVTGPHKQDIPE